MSNILDTVPSDLPLTDPILFSFLVIIDAMKANIKFNGKFDKANLKDLPAFEYAVNAWRVVNEPQFGYDYKYIEAEILAALWKDKPDTLDCHTTWGKYPNSTQTEKKYSMDYLYTFEDWRNQTFQELQQIISALTTKRLNVNDPKLLSDIFNFEILNNQVSYVYAKDATANKFFGVGATFTLRYPFVDCCPKIPETSLQLDYFKSLGFIFDFE